MKNGLLSKYHLFKGDDKWTPLIVALDIMQISNEKLVIALQNAFFLFFSASHRQSWLDIRK